MSDTLPLRDHWQLRPFQRTDVATLARHANDPRVAAQLRNRFPHPYTQRDAHDWITHIGEQDPPTTLAIVTDVGAVGGIGIELQTDVHFRCAEVGYWLGASYWGRGIVTEAVRVFTPWALERFSLLRLFAVVFETNPASARVLEKAGYACEGRLRKSVVKNGRVLDQLLYAVVRDDE